MKFLLLVLSMTSLPLLAQDGSVPLPIWEAPIPQSQGRFTVSLKSICSIAVEHYDLLYEDKTYPITECSVETIGGKTARFYFINEEKEEQDTPLESFNEAAQLFLPESKEEEKAGNKDRVLKVYPHSSTTSSVEFRLKSEGEVIEIYRSLHQAWTKPAPPGSTTTAVNY